MRFGVISNDMAACDGLFDKAGALADEFADDEKSGFRLVAIEKVEELRSNGRIRSNLSSLAMYVRISCL